MEPVSVTFLGKSLCRCDEVKDLGVEKLSWIISTGPTCIISVLIKRRGKGRFDTDRKQGNVAAAQ